MSKTTEILMDDFGLIKPHQTQSGENRLIEKIKYSYDFKHSSFEIIETRLKITKEVRYEMCLLRDEEPYTIVLLYFTFEDSWFTHFDCINSTGKFFIAQYNEDWKREKEMLMEADFLRPYHTRFCLDYHNRYIHIKHLSPYYQAKYFKK